MPYIKEEYRKEIEPAFENLYNTIISLPEEAEDGIITYIIFKLIKNFYYAESFSRLKDGVGVLDCACDEFKRRYLHHYEDKKLIDNGDV